MIDCIDDRKCNKWIDPLTTSTLLLEKSVPMKVLIHFMLAIILAMVRNATNLPILWGHDVTILIVLLVSEFKVVKSNQIKLLNVIPTQWAKMTP